MEAMGFVEAPEVQHLTSNSVDNFASSQQLFNELTKELSSMKAKNMDFTSLEGLIEKKGREVLRKLLEEHLRNRGVGNVGPAIVGKDEEHRGYKKVTSKRITSIFGKVENERLMYFRPGISAIFPKDASLNLPEKTYSHELTKRVCKETAKSSFDTTSEAILGSTGVEVGKRQIEELSVEGAKDFDNFYNHPCTKELLDEVQKSNLLVMTCDSKGIVMRKEDLKEATKKKADENVKKLSKRLSKGEKKNCKRMATVASVYNNDLYHRTPDEVMKRMSNKEKESHPKPVLKRVWASIEKDQKEVISDMFEEAVNRDPTQNKDWVCLVDGEPRQLENIEQEAKSRDANVVIIMDIIHVIEYLWKAARCFFKESSYECEAWVNDKTYQVLQGKSKNVARSIRSKAGKIHLSDEQEKVIKKSITYLTKKSKYLRYDEYLKRGYPIGTGVIEGACRHLIKDRMDLTGARWSLNGAEAILKLRSLASSGDFDEYWAYHELEEYYRNYDDKIGDTTESRQRGNEKLKLLD